MAILSWRATTTDSSTSASSIVLSKPTGTVEDDILVAFVAGQGVGSWSGPGGSLSDQTEVSNGDIVGRFSMGTASGSEPSSYTFNNTTGPGPVIGIMMAFKDAGSSSFGGTATDTRTATGSYLEFGPNMTVYAYASEEGGPLSAADTILTTGAGLIHGGMHYESAEDAGSAMTYDFVTESDDPEMITSGLSLFALASEQVQGGSAILLL